MSAIDYPIGSTVWSVLQVRSLDGVPEFYKAVLGWDVSEENGVRFFTNAGQRVAELVVDAQLADDAIGWLCFLGTDDLSATIKRAEGLGAELVVTERALGAAGNAAELIDPFGVRFGLAVLEPNQFVAQSTELGRLVLVDPTNHNAETQITFHLGLFPGDVVERMDHHINIIRNAQGLALRGAYGLDEELREVIPPHWLPWFSVADQARAVETAEANRGRVNTRDNELSFGLWGVVVDPQGGEFKTLQMTRPAV